LEGEAAPEPSMAAAPAGQASPRPAESGGPACPVCGAALASEATRCDVCGFEPGASVVIAGAQAAARPISPPSMEASARVCPVHGPLDPSWTRCPYCLREGKEGRLASGPIGSISRAAGVPESTTPPPSPAAIAPAVAPQSDAAPPPPQRMEPQEEIVPAAPPPPATPPAEVAPAASIAPPRPAPGPVNDLPRSSVGATFAIRRKPRVLAYLIEREGEALGRVHQLEEDVTDIGRDPRNHIVLGDVQISGFHARVERVPDGSFLVHDRNSTNGTYVNGEQIKEMRQINENDVVRMGTTTLVLKMVS
jgi:hypothetical protein